MLRCARADMKIYDNRHGMIKKIGFVSTRFSGTGGITMEAGKWADVLRKSGNQCYWFAGSLDRNPERSFLTPEAFFGHEQNLWINDQIFGRRDREHLVTEKNQTLKLFIKARIEDFMRQFSIFLWNAAALAQCHFGNFIGLIRKRTLQSIRRPFRMISP